MRLLRHVQVQIDHESFGRHWDQEFLPRSTAAIASSTKPSAITCGSLAWRGLIDEVAAASQGRRHEFLRDASPLPSIRQTVLSLTQQGLALGLRPIATGAAELERHLTRLGFGGRFQFLLSSVELGHTKSDPDGYRAAAVRFGRPADDRVRRESSPSSRHGGATGMPTIAFNYDNHARADLYLRQFDELVAILKTWPLSG